MYYTQSPFYATAQPTLAIVGPVPTQAIVTAPLQTVVAAPVAYLAIQPTYAVGSPLISCCHRTVKIRKKDGGKKGTATTPDGKMTDDKKVDDKMIDSAKTDGNRADDSKADSVKADGSRADGDKVDDQKTAANKADDKPAGKPADDKKADPKSDTAAKDDIKASNTAVKKSISAPPPGFKKVITVAKKSRKVTTIENVPVDTSLTSATKVVAPTTPAPTPDTKVLPKPADADSKATATKTDAKDDAKPAVQPGPKADAKSDAKTDDKPDTKADAKTEDTKTDAKARSDKSTSASKVGDDKYSKRSRVSYRSASAVSFCHKSSTKGRSDAAGWTTNHAAWADWSQDVADKSNESEQKADTTASVVVTAPSKDGGTADQKAATTKSKSGDTAKSQSDTAKSDKMDTTTAAVMTVGQKDDMTTAKSDQKTSTTGSFSSASVLASFSLSYKRSRNSSKDKTSNYKQAAAVAAAPVDKAADAKTDDSASKTSAVTTTSKADTRSISKSKSSSSKTSSKSTLTSLTRTPNPLAAFSYQHSLVTSGSIPALPLFNPLLPPALPAGTNYMYPQDHTTLHIFASPIQIWNLALPQPTLPTTPIIPALPAGVSGWYPTWNPSQWAYRVFKVPTGISVAEVIRNAVDISGEAAKDSKLDAKKRYVSWAVTEVIWEDGKWMKGTSIEYTNEKAKGSLKSMGWTRKRGVSLPPVWLCIHHVTSDKV